MRGRLADDRLQTPALLVRLDRVRANVRRALELIGTRWRPHVKTVKIPQVLDLLLSAGVRRFKCCTTLEAKILLSRQESGIDLLVAMAHRASNLERLVQLTQEFPDHRLSLLTEEPDHAEQVVRSGAQLGLYVDLNPGYDRTGIPIDDRDRILRTVRAAASRLRGLHDYEGQIRSPDPQRRRLECHAVYEQLVQLARELADAGMPVTELVTSGTPTFMEALEYSPFAPFDHQVSPGTVVYWDTLSEAFGLSGFSPAVTVLTRVVSRPGDRRITCDAGSKAIDASAGSPCVVVRDHPELQAGVPSEEHLPLTAARAALPPIGSLLELVPAHVCPTVNLASEAALLERDELSAIVPIAARGHETLPGGIPPKSLPAP